MFTVTVIMTNFLLKNFFANNFNLKNNKNKTKTKTKTKNPVFPNLIQVKSRQKNYFTKN